jgi:5-hydroxyisourate hydrolase-like protein (transthyretin family)
LPASAFVSLKLYNLNGRLQSEVIGTQQEAGSYSVNQRQMAAAAGPYLAVFKAGEYRNSQMVYVTHSSFNR